MGDTLALFPPKAHYQVTVTTMKEKYNLPGVFYLDFWPLGPSQLVVTDPDVALHMTAVKNHPKHPDEAYFIDPVAGRGNIVSANGPVWKHLHQMIAPAFAISRVRGMVAMIAEDVMDFNAILNDLATSGDTFSIEQRAGNLAFTVITKAIFGFTLNSQHTTSAAWRDFTIIRQAWSYERDGLNPYKNFMLRRKRIPATRRLDALLSGLVKDRFEVLKRDQVDVSDKRSLSIMYVFRIFRDFAPMVFFKSGPHCRLTRAPDSCTPRTTGRSPEVGHRPISSTRPSIHGARSYPSQNPSPSCDRNNIRGPPSR